MATIDLCIHKAINAVEVSISIVDGEPDSTNKFNEGYALAHVLRMSLPSGVFRKFCAIIREIADSSCMDDIE